MKNIIFILLLFVFKFSYSQSDSVLVSTGPGVKRPLEVVLIINGFLFDPNKSNEILKKIRGQIEKKTFYTSTDGYKKMGIVSKDGIMIIWLKRGVIFDYDKLKIIYSLDRKL